MSLCPLLTCSLTLVSAKLSDPRIQFLSSNDARVDFEGCFGCYKQSRNGREWGEAGLEGFLELKAIFGYEFLGSENSESLD
jgi:hypothetical protein